MPVFGTRSPGRLSENVATAQVTLDAGDLARIEEILPHGAAGARYPGSRMPTG